MKRELEPYQMIERSIIKKYRKELWTPFIVAVKRYELVQEGDRIAVCISGGKDSMLMAKLMQELQRHSDVPFELVFLVMDPGYNEINRQKIESNAELLHIPVTIFESNIFSVANNTEKNPCYLCARMRRGPLYSKAIIPGKKMPWRLYDENGQAQCDLIAMDGEVIEAGKPVKMVNLDPDAIERTITITPTRVKRLLVPHILNGELAIELPGIAEKKAYIAKQLTEETWETELRIEMPHKHYVNMTPAVAECRAKMYSELHGGKV